MLATLSEPFDEPGWLYEIKWDGYRALAMMDGKEVNLISRNNKNFNARYQAVHAALKNRGLRAVVDGEIVVLDKDGKPDFNLLQNWQGKAGGELVYYVFDLLWLDGYDLTLLPLEQRRLLLRERLPGDPGGTIRFSENFVTTATGLLEALEKMGMEGLIAKRSGSAYYPGIRTKDWVKLKTRLRQEVVIGGFTRIKGTPKPFSALLVGQYKDGKFHYSGKVGTGFSQPQQRKMLRMFEPYIREKSPFQVIPVVNRPVELQAHPSGVSVVFLDPQLVCEVHYTQITAEGIMRHPAFIGLREDKPAQEVEPEVVVPAEKIISPEPFTHTTMNTGKNLLDPSAETQDLKVNSHLLHFTHLDKLYWPEDKLAKRDLLEYYHRAASYMLPFLKGRPMSLHRHPEGYAGPGFYQKDVTGKVPDWVETLPYRSEEEPDQAKKFLVCTDEASLLLMANLGCIEINPWNSTVKDPDHPDWCVLDLDPDKNNTFDQVIEVARMAHNILDAAGVPAYCKTSGSTGLHIYIPLNARYTYGQSAEFARLIVNLVQHRLPELTSVERHLSERKGKIYLDFLQNKTQATLAAPFSVRPKPQAPVSMPLHWDEVKKGLKVTDFTIRNAVPLLEERSELFKGVLGKGIDMPAVLEKLEAGWKEAK